MAKKRAFFSFDFDEDQNLKHHMVWQMKLPTSPFEGGRLVYEGSCPAEKLGARSRSQNQSQQCCGGARRP